MSKVTAVVIAKNEEKMIEKCLESLSFADSILVVNNSSEDRTIEIAKKKGAKVIDIDLNDFSKIREVALDKVKTTYILYVDADERVTPQLADEIKNVISNNDSNIGCYKLVRQNYYLGKNVWPTKEKLERLFRTKSLKGWKGTLHETAEFDGDVGELSAVLEHYTHRDLTSMVEKTNKWSEIEAYNRYKANHPKMQWWRFPRVMIQAFLKSYVKDQGWKAGTVGLIESTYQAFSIFITYAKLWEIQEKKQN